MASYNRAAAGMGYTGYPARIFFEMTNFAKGTQTYVELIWILSKWYSHLAAYLPIMMEKEIEEKFNPVFSPMLHAVDQKLADAWQMYDPKFESLEMCNPDEKEFLKFLFSIFYDLDQITGKAKVIDKVKPDDGEVLAG